MSEAVDSRSEEEVSALRARLGIAQDHRDGDLPRRWATVIWPTRPAFPRPPYHAWPPRLVGAGYLRQSRRQRALQPGAGACWTWATLPAPFRSPHLARPHLTALAEFAGASVHIGVRDELDMLIIDSLRPRSALITSRIDVGSRMAIATSAAGRAYLAALPGPERARSFSMQIRLASGENWAAVEPRSWRASRSTPGWAICTSFGEWHPHIHALGFSLRGPARRALCA